MKSPWLSVLMPVYNGETYIASALDSIIRQGDQDIECIVVEGKSTDNTIEILKSYQSKLPLQILHMERTSNWIAKTNLALSMATGKYSCFLHHDDLWLADRLQTIKKIVAEHPEIICFLHPSIFIDSKGINLGMWRCPLPRHPAIVTSNLMIERLLIQNFISIVSPIFKREIAAKVGGLDETLWYTADWDFWLKIASQGSAIYYPKPLSCYRIHPSSQTTQRSSYLQDFRNQLNFVFEKHFSAWETSAQDKIRHRAVGKFSIEVNSTLAGYFHGHTPDYFKILKMFWRLGPIGGYKYIRVSRILERTFSRLKANLLLHKSINGRELP